MPLFATNSALQQKISTASCQLLSASCHLPSAFCLLPPASCLLPSANDGRCPSLLLGRLYRANRFRCHSLLQIVLCSKKLLLPPAFCLLPPAFCLLPPANCLLPPANDGRCPSLLLGRPYRANRFRCHSLLQIVLCSKKFLLPSAFCQLPSANCLLPPASCKRWALPVAIVGSPLQG